LCVFFPAVSRSPAQLRAPSAETAPLALNNASYASVAVSPDPASAFPASLVVSDSGGHCWTGAASLQGAALSCSGQLSFQSGPLPVLSIATPCAPYTFPPLSPPPAPPAPPLPPPSPPLPPPEPPEAPQAPLNPAASVRTIVHNGDDKILVGIVVGCLFGAFACGLVLRYMLYILGTTAEQRAEAAAAAAALRKAAAAKMRAAAAERRRLAAEKRAAAIAAGEDVPEKKKKKPKATAGNPRMGGAAPPPKRRVMLKSTIGKIKKPPMPPLPLPPPEEEAV